MQLDVISLLAYNPGILVSLSYLYIQSLSSTSLGNSLRPCGICSLCLVPEQLQRAEQRLHSEDGAVALDVDRWTAGRGTLLLRDLASALPGCALQDLSKGELVLDQAKLCADDVADAITE